MLPQYSPLFLAQSSLRRPKIPYTIYTTAIYRICELRDGITSTRSSVTYSRAEKRGELFHADSRFLILSTSPPYPGSNDDPSPRMPGSLPPDKGKGKARATGVNISPSELYGFCMFRFDTEETLTEDDVEVIYCYEIQLSSRARGKGLGTILMRHLEDIGRQQGMAKAMLTCLKRNTAALSFYAKQGYMPDEIDPTNMAESDEWQEVDSDGEIAPIPEIDYCILSKHLHAS
ncbi:acyl-CoA N-acyltransferase [Kockovaella imperatae]|uniref:N-alpha-acetyltransferase 40 n=1 Tax=Kockovaella imperatae TaxID=4999 RepID=A0A1Y1UGZ1_9TREE|nr:acyl-CoA N-acyltransferase [Kockovaella imperatae]ORX37321.1 acyl-CoA N-acyltransferase [Kockovaella imperatae]